MKIMLLISLIFTSFLFAGNPPQDHENIRASYEDYVLLPFNIGLWPGISTSDMWAEEAGDKKIYHTGLSLSLIGMRAARLRGVDLAGIFSIYTEGMQGVQGSGVFNIVNGNVAGVQGAGVFNVVDGEIKGIQGSGIFNIHNGDFRGIQGSGVFNIQNGDFLGLRGSSVFNIQNGDFKGLQGSGIFSLQNGTFRGAQFSGIFSAQNGDFYGIQASQIINILGGRFRGVQIAGINVTSYFERGLQIGFINVTESHDGIPIAFFTYVDDTPLNYRVWLDDSRFVNAGIRSGNDNWYNLVYLGRRVEGEIRYHSFGAGFGRKYFLGDNWDLDFGLSASKLLDDNFKDTNWRSGRLGYISRLSLVFRYGLPGEGALILGPVLNGWVSKTVEEDLSNSLILDEFEDNFYYRVWPGFVVGLEL
jgi:hypothetical protein